MVTRDIPLNQGCLAPITVKIPPGSLLNPSPSAAVVGGNVLTSQRVTDVVLKAFQAAAASQVRKLVLPLGAIWHILSLVDMFNQQRTGALSLVRQYR